MKTAAVFGEIKNGKPNVSERYTEHISACGISVKILCGEASETAAEEYDYLIVCGGGDIDPLLYGQQNTENIKFDRGFDILEQSYIKAFLKEGKAILGICRGMQSINVALGGTLIQDIPSMLGLCHFNCGGRDCEHEIKISKLSKLHSVMGLRAVVNSLHHQCIHTLGEGLKIAAVSHDGIIEAIESEKVLGVQWHPERMSGNTLFEYFFENY